MAELTLDTAREMLAVIPSDDRDTWLRVGMAIHDAFGDSGRDLYHEWSSLSGRYREPDCESAWRSFREGPITHRTLHYLARQYGYRGGLPKLRPRPKRRPVERKRSADEAAKVARQWISEATLKPHPYAVAKGLPGYEGLVDSRGRLLIPARRGGKVVAVQTITADGEKRFLPRGCSMRGATHRIGRRRLSGRTWLVEGWATGMTVLEALSAIHQLDGEVMVCFSAGQLVRIGKQQPRTAIVIADNDASGAGEVAAKKTGLRYWLPPEPGDANDYYLRHGLRALARELRKLFQTGGKRTNG